MKKNNRLEYKFFAAEGILSGEQSKLMSAGCKIPTNSYNS